MLAHFVGCYSVATPPASEVLTRAPAALPWQRQVSTDRKLTIWATRTAVDPTGSVALAGQLVVYGTVAGDDDELGRWLTVTAESGFKTALRMANGTFALAAYGNGELCLATDSLGARPLYYAIHAEQIWFATSFPLLRDALPVRGEPDIQALAEKAAFHYPLGRRTLSTAISLLTAGEMLIADAAGWRLERYHDWRTQPVSPRDRARELKDCAAAFNLALRARIQPGGTQCALLSGGLDSRLIVAALKGAGESVQARNCSAAGTLDEIYCRQFADLAEVPVERVEWTLDLLQATAGRTTAEMLRRALAGWVAGPVFSGDGGGEVFGFLTFPGEYLAALAETELDAVLPSIAGKMHISPQVVRPEFAERLEALALAGLRAELAPLAGLHPHKALQIFVLLNDLRSHLHEYFDSTAADARELLLPFYDRRVIAAALALAPPFDDYIGHRFYYELLPQVSLLSTAVPWQHYPTSLPCPLAAADQGEAHWHFIRRVRHRHAAYWRRAALHALLRRRKSPVFRRGRIFAALMLDLLPGRDYDYLLEQYLTLSEDLAAAAGDVDV